MPIKKNNFTWREKACSLANQVKCDRLHPDAIEWLQSARNRSVLVACSGGADSVFMLCLLWAYAREFAVELTVAHYNHRWCGRSSDADADFVRKMAGGLDCRFVVEERPEEKAAFTETKARDLRLEFLRRTALKRGCEGIAFGHQQNDILETQLQRLVRGVSSEGLAAPRPVHFFSGRPTHIRPILNVCRSDIRKFLTSYAVPWCEDSSNEDTSIARNALRHAIVPELGAALGRDVSAGAARTRMLLTEDAEALDVMARERLPESFAGADRLDRNLLKTMPAALVRRAMTAWLHSHDLIASISGSCMDRLIKAIYEDKRKNRFSAGSAFIVLSMDEVRIDTIDEEPKPLEPCMLRPGEKVILSTGASLSADLIDLDEGLRNRILTDGVDPSEKAYVAMDSVEFLRVRGRMPGDRFRPLGAPGGKNLKARLLARRISGKDRDSLPVILVESGEILWVPGLPPSEVRRIGPKTVRALRLTYRQGGSLSSL